MGHINDCEAYATQEGRVVCLSKLRGKIVADFAGVAEACRKSTVCEKAERKFESKVKKYRASCAEHGGEDGMVACLAELQLIKPQWRRIVREKCGEPATPCQRAKDKKAAYEAAFGEACRAKPAAEEAKCLSELQALSQQWLHAVNKACTDATACERQRANFTQSAYEAGLKCLRLTHNLQPACWADYARQIAQWTQQHDSSCHEKLALRGENPCTQAR
jgi:hypothetical protein